MICFVCAACGDFIVYLLRDKVGSNLESFRTSRTGVVGRQSIERRSGSNLVKYPKCCAALRFDGSISRYKT